MLPRPEIALTGLLLLAGCSEQPTGPAAKPQQDSTSFYQREVAPLLRARCASCHLTGTEPGKLQLTPDQAVASLVDVKAEGAKGLVRVVAGAPEESYLIMKLEGTHLEKGGSGSTMPFGTTPLSPQDVEKIRTWIKEGAKP